MPLATIEIPVSGGAVNSRDPVLLLQGEMELIQNGEYRPNDPGIWSVLGQTAFNSSATAAIVGGVFVRFDGASDRIIISTGTAWLQAAAADTGSFASLVTGLTAATQLDGVNFQNFAVLWDGVNRARVVAGDLEVTLLGMQANTTAPTVDTKVGAGTGFTLDSGNTIDYWIEERVKDSDDNIVKRSITDLDAAEFSSTSIGGLTASRKIRRRLREIRNSSTITRAVAEETGEVALLTAALTEVVKPRIFRPDIVNTDATHWAVFASGTNGGYPIGAELGEAAIATTYIDDTRTTDNPDLPGGAIYETISVNLLGLAAVSPKNGPPPIAETGDVFDDSLVLNDISSRTSIVWSYPREFHAFPPLNRAYIPSRPGEHVTFIRRLGVQLLVGTTDSVWNFSWLPRPDDASFQRERGKEQILGAHGIVGPLAGCIFSYGRGLRLAYVSYYGIHITDGLSWDDISDDLDFDSVIERAYLHKSALIDNPSKYRLEWYFVPTGQTTIQKVMHFYYHPYHAKSGQGGGFRAKISGSNDLTATDAFLVSIANEKRVFTTASDGKVYRQGVGALDGVFKVRTKSYAVNKIGGEVGIRSTSMHHRRASVSIPAQVAYVMHNPDQDDTRATGAMDFGDPRSSSIGLDGVCEEFQLEVQVNDPPEQICINSFGVDVEDQGESEK
jgi:hypothetical protein